MSYLSEEDVKTRLILLALQRAGWPTTKLMAEYSIRKDRFRIVPDRYVAVPVPAKDNRPDYLLCRRANCPIAVLEAKGGGRKAEDGIDQAVRYAQILGLPFAYSSAGEKFIERNLVTGKQRELAMEEFPGQEQLWEMYCKAKGISGDSVNRLDDAPYYTTSDGKVPRYYQMLAINTVEDAIVAKRRRRALLVMATGTGKTYTAFQIVWRLRQAGVAKNVLYLADRNQLVDQTLIGDFAPLSKIQTKIRDGKIDKNYEIYFGLYQQLKKNKSAKADKQEESFADNFRQVRPDYFDLIIVDECHRGSAKDESSWREILDYFSSAVQIGLTATPSDKEGADNAAYFGEPLYTYSLKQGIDDGFLAPFQVVNVHLDKDVDGWEPDPGEVDSKGEPIPQRLYTRDDFDRNLILRQRTLCVARVITEYLNKLGRMSKTIVFCTTQDHAGRMRDALRQINADMMAENPHYIVRMTADDQDGKALYKEFCSVDEPYPVVVTTSKLLTTGADTKCVKLIVLDTPIMSMTEFKQIIGRGTRLFADEGKTFFTILDFRGACENFKDPKFDGEPEQSLRWPPDADQDYQPLGGGKGGGTDGAEEEEGGDEGAGGDGGDGDGGDTVEVEPPKDKRYVYEVNGVSVEVIGARVSYLDKDGKLVTPKFIDYTRENILKQFGSKAKFMEVWNGEEEKRRIIDDLAKQGVLIEHLRQELGNPDADEFDLICSIAYGVAPLTRQARASRATRSRFLDKYQGIARQVLERLLDIYAHEGVLEVDRTGVLKSKEFWEFGSPTKIVREFGGKDQYREAVRDLENALYQEHEIENNNFTQAGI